MEEVEVIRNAPQLRYELILVILISLLVLVPGIWRYSLVDPWETHYGEVARMMRQEHDLVHMQWPGGESKNPGDIPRGRRPVHYLDADRLIAWSLYWRGENFWSGDEIFGWASEMRTGFEKPDSPEFLKYMNDRTLAPFGRRYFVVTEAGRAAGVKSLLPTQRARDTFEVIETTSNKFSMTSFVL